MAFKAPQFGYNGPRLQTGQIVRASAESFGAAQGRELQEAGRMGLRSGLNVLAAAQEQQRKCDTAVAKDKVNQARIEMLEGADKIRQERGANAQNARAEMNSLFDTVNRKYGASVAGGNVELQEMYGQSMEGMRRTYDLAGARHQVRQMREYEEAAYAEGNAVEDAEIDTIFRGNSPLSGDGTQEVLVATDGEVLPPINPDEEMVKRIMMRRENIAMRLAGSPAGYIKQMQDDEEARMHGIAINALAENNPRSALEYLNMPEVRAVVPPKEWKKTSDWLTGVVKKADVSEDAEKSLAELGPQKALIKAYSDPRYQTDPDALKQYVSIVTNLNTQNDNLAKAEQAGLMEKYFDELRETGKIPLEATKDIETFKEMTSLKSTWDSFIKENPVPDMDWIENFDNMTQAQRDEFMSTAKGHAEFDHKTAGDSGWKEFFEKKRTNAKGSADKASVYGGMNLSEQIEANFPALAYSTTEKGWLWDSETAVGGMEYDSSDPAHKRMKSNILHHFRNRWNDTDLYKDEKPEDRAENILFDIIGEYRDQKLDLDSPLYDSATATQLQDEIDNPRVEYVNPDTGKTEVTIGNAKEGTVHTFDKIEPETIQAILPGMTIGESFRVPETAEAGEYKGVKYEPGDIIVSGKDRRTWAQDSILVYDSNMNLKPESVDIGLSSVVGAPVSSPAQQYAAPPKTLKMMAWEKTHGATFEWQEFTGRYIAKTIDPKGERNVWYQAMPDDEIAYIGSVNDSDEQILAQKEAGREEDNREELRRLRREYKNVTGQTAKESGYYVGE